MPRLMVLPRTLRPLLLLALIAVLALVGALPLVSSPLHEHSPTALAAVDLADHGHSHDADNEAAPGHTHHQDHHSHAVIGPRVTLANLASPVDTRLGWVRSRVTLPAYASDLYRPPRTVV